MNLTSAQINISWFCDFHSNKKTSCPYCWVTMAQSDRSRKLDHAAEEWLTAIRRQIPASALIDFVGGEPTLFPKFKWLVEELSSTHRWSVTSNMSGDRWKSYCEKPVGNCISWTASYHYTSRDSIHEFAAKCLIASRHYPLSVNVVDYPTYDAAKAAKFLEDYGLKVFFSPFEDVRNLNVAGAVPLTCNGGMTHILIDPEGHVYKCLSQERRADRERWRLGNMFSGEIQWPSKRSLCFIPCDAFYVLNQQHATADMWELDVREADIAECVSLEAYRETFNVPATPLRKFIDESAWKGRTTDQAKGDLLQLPVVLPVATDVGTGCRNCGGPPA